MKKILGALMMISSTVNFSYGSFYNEILLEESAKKMTNSIMNSSHMEDFTFTDNINFLDDIDEIVLLEKYNKTYGVFLPFNKQIEMYKKDLPYAKVQNFLNKSCFFYNSCSIKNKIGLHLLTNKVILKLSLIWENAKISSPNILD